MKINTVIRIAFIFLALINLACATTAGLLDARYQAILNDIRNENLDFAYLKMNSYVKDYPASKHLKEVRFALCEYDYKFKKYKDAINKLSEYINDYRSDESAIFAKVLLYKILSEYQKEPSLTETIKEEFFAKSLFLVFSESKSKKFNSIINNSYRIINYVDKIEVIRNDELFFTVTP